MTTPLFVELDDEIAALVDEMVARLGVTKRGLVQNALRAYGGAKTAGKWTTEIRFVDCYSLGAPEPIIREDENDFMVLFLKAEPGQFDYDGRSAYARKPMIDPIRRRILFIVELYERRDP